LLNLLGVIHLVILNIKMPSSNPSTYPERRRKQAENIDSVAADMGKIPPQAIDLEEAVLGAAMLEKDLVMDILDILRPESFYKEAHQQIFAAIVALSDRSEPIDLLTVSEELKRSKHLRTAGGRPYLARLTLKVGSGAHIANHAAIIAQKFLQRELIRISSGIQHECFDDASDVADTLDRAQNDILLLSENNIKRQALPVGEVAGDVVQQIEEARNRKEEFSGIPSGFVELDRMTQGWQKSNLIIAAGRTSMGKTAFVLSMARNMILEHQCPVAFFSLEMSAEELVMRLLMMESRIGGEKLKSGKLSDQEMEQLKAAESTLKEHSMLYIDDSPALSIGEFRAKVRRLYKQHNIRCVVIDYLQLMTGPNETRGFREQEIASISRSLKGVAKDLNIPIIALSQMNRQIEGRSERTKRPQLSDLRESGAIEQDADVVLFVHRPEVYELPLFDGSESAGMAEIIIAKQRNGRLGEIKLRFRKELTKFESISDEQIEEVLGASFPTATTPIPSRMNDDSPLPF
jgi:replicative DNA helicase